MKKLWIVGVMVLSGCRAQMFSYGYRDGYSDALKSKKFAAGSLPRMTHLHQF